MYETIKQIIKERNYKYVMLRGFGMGLGEFDSLFSERDEEVFQVNHQSNCSLVETEIGIFKLF
jgi:hypothetical protein